MLFRAPLPPNATIINRTKAQTPAPCPSFSTRAIFLRPSFRAQRRISLSFALAPARSFFLPAQQRRFFFRAINHAARHSERSEESLFLSPLRTSGACEQETLIKLLQKLKEGNAVMFTEEMWKMDEEEEWESE